MQSFHLSARTRSIESRLSGEVSIGHLDWKEMDLRTSIWRIYGICIDSIACAPGIAVVDWAICKLRELGSSQGPKYTKA